ncbi:exosortase X [Hymenobacter defluvii]|uniref:Exosortase/archaeosortase family protein n=1 Tax=Hymenobacter defluvii TaxID=2054411 RepID=A0ABS3TIX2_9BACT|nr:exosortase/archaeosortase family protein [Hymenobacter defluvii]MBO3273338.1 exosortase/archaeosortase family protein [Hymenobacter defluvii]
MVLFRSLTTHPQRRFLLTAAGLYLLWWLGYEQGLRPDGRLDQALSVGVARAAAGSLHAVGFAAATAPATPTTVTMHGSPAVLVGDPCNGLALYTLFTGFVLAYPGSRRRKAWFIPLGIGAVYLLNVLRVALLALNHTYWYHTVDFNHHYTFSFVAYVAILGLWHLWVRQGRMLPGAYAAS